MHNSIHLHLERGPNPSQFEVLYYVEEKKRRTACTFGGLTLRRRDHSLNIYRASANSYASASLIIIKSIEDQVELLSIPNDIEEDKKRYESFSLEYYYGNLLIPTLH